MEKNLFKYIRLVISYKSLSFGRIFFFYFEGWVSFIFGFVFNLFYIIEMVCRVFVFIIWEILYNCNCIVM